MNEAEAERLLRLLVEADLPFTVVGGLAAISYGASTFTKDVNVAMPLDDVTVSKLLKALEPYRPRHVTRPDLDERGGINEPERPSHRGSNQGATTRNSSAISRRSNAEWGREGRQERLGNPAGLI